MAAASSGTRFVLPSVAIIIALVAGGLAFKFASDAKTARAEAEDRAAETAALNHRAEQAQAEVERLRSRLDEAAVAAPFDNVDGLRVGAILADIVETAARDGRSTTVLATLRTHAETVADADLTPDARAAARLAIARGLRQLDQHDDAIALALAAVRDLEQSRPADDPDLAHARLDLADHQLAAGDAKGAAMTIGAAASPLPAEAVAANARLTLVNLRIELARLNGRPMTDDVTDRIADAAEALGNEHADVIRTRAAAGRAELAMRRPERAAPLLARAFAGANDAWGATDVRTAAIADDYAAALERSGQASAAIPVLRQAIDAASGGWGVGDPRVLNLKRRLAAMLEQSGQPLGASALMAEVRLAEEATHGERSDAALAARQEEGRLQIASGRLDEALLTLQPVYETRMDRLGPQHPDTVSTASLIATIYDATGQDVLATEIRELIPTAGERKEGEK